MNNLAANHDSELRDIAKRILSNTAVIHERMIEIGKDLSRAREKINNRSGFLEWLNNQFGWSEQTAENYISVFLRMPSLPAGSESRFDVRALYLLSSPSTTQESRDAAIALSAHRHIDYEAAYILARAPLEIRDRFVSGGLAKVATYDLTRAYLAAPEEVQGVILQYSVSSAAAAAYLAAEYRAGSAVYQDILRNDGFIGRVHLRQANERDINHWIQQRGYERLEAEKAARAFASEQQAVADRQAVKEAQEEGRAIIVTGTITCPVFSEDGMLLLDLTGKGIPKYLRDLTITFIYVAAKDEP